MDMRIPPLRIKIMLESNPLTFRIIVFPDWPYPLSLSSGRAKGPALLLVVRRRAAGPLGVHLRARRELHGVEIWAGARHVGGGGAVDIDSRCMPRRCVNDIVVYQ